MYEQANKSKVHKSGAVANSVGQNKSSLKQGFWFIDNRSMAIAQRKLQMQIDNDSSQKQQSIQKKKNKIVQCNIRINGETFNQNPTGRKGMGSPQYRFLTNLSNEVGARGFQLTQAAINWAIENLIDNGNNDFPTWDNLIDTLWNSGHLMRVGGRGGITGPQNLGQRPGFSQQTQNAVPVNQGQHRRHIIASGTLGLGIERAIVALQVQNTPPPQILAHLNTFLQRQNKPQETSIAGAGRAIWVLVNDHVGNLWAGDSLWNMAIGFVRGPLIGMAENLNQAQNYTIMQILADLNAIRPNFQFLQDQWKELITVVHQRINIAAKGTLLVTGADVVSILLETVSNCDLDIPQPANNGAINSQYFENLMLIYNRIKAGDQYMFEVNGYLDMYLNLDWRR